MSIYGGPFPMGHVPQKCSANGCECKTTASDEWVRCQGNDTCLARLCPNHEDSFRCDSCGLPCCEDHIYDVGRERLCGICLQLAAANDDDAAMMALACRIMEALREDLEGPEICSQDEAATWALLAKAGCSRVEAAAAIKGRVN